MRLGMQTAKVLVMMMGMLTEMVLAPEPMGTYRALG